MHMKTVGKMIIIHNRVTETNSNNKLFVAFRTVLT